MCPDEQAVKRDQAENDKSKPSCFKRPLTSLGLRLRASYDFDFKVDVQSQLGFRVEQSVGFSFESDSPAGNGKLGVGLGNLP